MTVDEKFQHYKIYIEMFYRTFVYNLRCVITLLKTINHEFHGRIAEQNAIVGTRRN